MILAGEIPVYCEHTSLVNPSTLELYPENARIHDEQQLDIILRVIKAIGWRAPITVSKQTNRVTRGNGRVMAALRGNLPLVPVDYQDYANEQAEIADLLSDNRIQELNYNDSDKLRAMIDQLRQEGTDLSLTGFDQSILDQIMNDVRAQVTISIGEQAAPESGDQIRQAMLIYPADEFTAVAENLKHYIGRHKLESPSEAVLHLLRNA
jgi:hypothetical protein